MRPLDIHSPAWQAALATLLRQGYAAYTSAAFPTLIEVLFGPPKRCLSSTGHGPLPRWFLIDTGAYVLFLVPGIERVEQTKAIVFAQAGFKRSLLSGAVQPQFGEAGVNLADSVLRFAGPTGTPLVFVGHSYGGVTGLIAAAIVKSRSHRGAIQVLTYGSPAPGNADFVTAINGIALVRLVNDNDPVPSLPSNPGLQATAGVLAGPAGLVVTAGYTQPGGGVIQAADGTRTRSNTPPVSALDVPRFLNDRFIGTEAYFGPGHELEEYGRRATEYANAVGSYLPVATSVTPAFPPQSPSYVPNVPRSLREVLRAIFSPKQETELMSDASSKYQRIPVAFRPKGITVGSGELKTYFVTWMGRSVVENVSKSRAKVVAKWLYKFLRCIQAEKLVQKENLATSFSEYIAAASGGSGEFVPPMTTGVSV